MNVEATDCSPLPVRPTPELETWLRDLVSHFQTNRHVLAFGDRRLGDEPVVYCERDGRWWAGRYVGVLRHGGGRLTIRPRFGMATLAAWLGHAVDAVPVVSPGRLREDVPFVVQLLAMVWGRTFADAARHGLPALRRERRHIGSAIRGRLDIRGTLGEMLANREAAVSVTREKTLNNPAGQTLAAAYRVLHRRLGVGEANWLPERVAELLPALLATVGSNPKPPTEAELARVRYTPITLGFAKAVHVSRLILRHRGLLSEVDTDGESEGVLFDVAELWELFVLAAVRRAVTGLEVLHGTSQTLGRESLLVSETDRSATMGELRPDAVIRFHHRVVGILDAKYKSLWPTQLAPHGPQREDLYQLASYLSGFNAEWGMLAYPADPDRVGIPRAEAKNPWRLEDNRRIKFLTLPHDLEGAIQKLRAAINA